MRKVFLIIVINIFYTPLFAQQITYSQPQDGQLTRSLSFEIIGKVANNYLVYKNIRTKNLISVYDNDMKLVNEVELKNMPDKTLNVDFVAFPEYAWLVYQYQRRNTVYCMAMKLNGEGKLLSDPIELDTSSINFFADNKIYSTIKSEDKNKIMIYKIQKKSDVFNFTTLLFDNNMDLIHKTKIESDFEYRKNVFSDFFVTNTGDFVFTRGNRSNSRDYIQNLSIITKTSLEDTFRQKQLDLHDRNLDEVKLKVDNINKHYIINSFYYTNKRGNADGLYTAVINEINNDLVSENFAEFGESIRAAAKSGRSNKTAFNDFFIRNIVLKKDGGFLMTAEDFSTQSRSNTWNRYDYLYGYPSFSTNYYNYYSPYSNGYYGNRYNNYNPVRYLYNNIVILSMDSTGKIEWSSVVAKEQFDDDNDNYLSYAEMLTGGQVHFLFNNMERRKQILSDQSITSTGDVDRNPPLHNLDRGYEFMPRFAKQVSANQMIVPCTYRNFICFAKIEY